MKEYDLIVIGAGPGGYEAAFEAADLGLKTALVEKEQLGGTCLNHGCIPTKSLLHGAELYRRMKEAPVFGVSAEAVSYDPEKMQERKRDVVSQLQKGIEATAKKKKVDVIRGVGTVLGDGQVAVRTQDGEELLSGKDILLATGSRPAMPPIPGIGLPNVVTSDELLEWNQRIERLAIIGGGVIGVEFASLYQALGTEVAIIEATPQLLPNLDRELAQSIKMLLKKRGVALYTGAKVEAIRQGENGDLICDVCAEKPETVQADVVLVCVGRRPWTEGVFADGVQAAMERGRILINDHYETSLPHVYAIGDVTGGVMLAHAATAMGRNAVRCIADLPPCSDMRFIPSCVYTEPEIACVGLTLDEAKAAGIDADSKKTVMSANGKTVLTDAERGYIRVVYEKPTGKLLGAQMMCERATDMISGFAQALCSGLTIKELSQVIRPHPTFSEAITDAVRV
ncbi:MAG: dihydrolipoyl dehydrogenase [Clostridia bacterium]|nr:dihydrolipoyl dehydrogenase [Clostridia bacterium]